MFAHFVPDLYIKSIYDLPIDDLLKRNINTLIFDIDNTIVPYSSKIPSKKEIEYIQSLNEKGFNIVILSNNSKKRVEEFCRPLNTFAIHRAVKPFIHGIKRAMRQTGSSPQNTAIIGDQIFTDIWCGKNAGVYTILVAPITNVENFTIKLKRILEKKVLRLIQESKES